jgi:hypothetical protein
VERLPAYIMAAGALFAVPGIAAAQDLAAGEGGTINHHFGPTGTNATLIAPLDFAKKASM